MYGYELTHTKSQGYPNFFQHLVVTLYTFEYDRWVKFGRLG